MTKYSFVPHEDKQEPNLKATFQNVFEFPDFIEMRPILRDAVRGVARQSFKNGVLPVKVERLTTQLEEQLERETRKYESQNGVYGNQVSERNALTRLFTQVLQFISKEDTIDQETEDIIYAVNQTRISLAKLPVLSGAGPLYESDADREIIPNTFYYFVAKELMKPYLNNVQGPIIPENVTATGRALMVRLTTYAFRDWDAYLVHEYDEQHILKNKKGLANGEYYDQLEKIELKYADHHYGEVLADTYRIFSKIIVPKYADQFEIMSTPLDAMTTHSPELLRKLQDVVSEQFKIDDNGAEHVMDDVLMEIRKKYNFYRTTFA